GEVRSAAILPRWPGRRGPPSGTTVATGSGGGSRMPRAAAVRVKVRSKVVAVARPVLPARGRLRHSGDGRPGIVRERVRGTFRYRDAAGRLVRDGPTLARIRALAIPPAWEGVWICPAANGHVQATGRDARGRKQYRYHPAWTARCGEAKFSRMAALGRAPPRVRRRVEA